MTSQPRRVIAILGMHRSGTSCLTGSLQEAGLELGE
ncbi:MAG TPA: sulfotransferase family protein, partial [Halieaceae bacterium]|nr:sulfotransferase family protein [Halieaceae bacterium]